MEINYRIIVSLVILFAFWSIIDEIQLSDFYLIGLVLVLVSFNSLYGENKLSILFPFLLVPAIIHGSLPQYIIIIAVISSVVTSYYTPLSYALIPLGVSLFSYNLPEVIQLLTFFSLSILYGLFKYDFRGYIVSGIVLIISAAYYSSYQVGLGDLAYYNFLFGVSGLIAEGGKVRVPERVKVPLILAVFPLLTFLSPLPFSYYYWNPISFYFKYSIVNLWLPGLGYIPEIEEFPVYFLSHFLVYKFGQYIGTHIFIFLVYYISSLSSYLLFSTYFIERKVKIASAILYSMLTPILSPSLSITYSLLPLAVYLARRVSVRNIVAFSALTTLSSSIAFPFSFSIITILENRVRKEYILFSVLLSLFWIIPFVFLGFPESQALNINNIILYVLLLLSAGLFYSKREYLAIASVFGISYIILSYPYASLIYPFVILSIFLIILNQDKKAVISIALVTLFLVSLYNFSVQSYFYKLSPQVEKTIKVLENDTLEPVYWELPCELISPQPITNNTLIAKYIVNNSGILPNPRFIGYPIYVNFTNNSSSYLTLKVQNLTNSEIERFNGSLIWEMLKPYTESEIALLFPSPTYLNGTINIKLNYTDLQYFYIQIYTSNGTTLTFHNTTTVNVSTYVDIIYLSEYYPMKANTTVNVTVFYYHEGVVKNLLIIPKISKILNVTYSIIPNGLKIKIFSNSEIIIRYFSGLNLTYYINGTEITNLTKSYVLPPGYYIIIAKFPYTNYLRYGIIGSVIGFLIALVYSVLYTRKGIITKMMKTIRRRIPT